MIVLFILGRKRQYDINELFLFGCRDSVLVSC